MESDRLARLAVAGPVAILVAVVAMAIGASSGNVLAGWLMVPAVALVVLGTALWTFWPLKLSERITWSLVALVAAAVVFAAIVFLVIPLFAIRGVGLSGAGVYTLAYGPPALIAVGSVLARARSEAPVISRWLLLWVAVVVVVFFGEQATYWLTDATGADAIAGTIAFLGAPAVALSAWVGVCLASLASAWWTRRLTEDPPAAVAADPAS